MIHTQEALSESIGQNLAQLSEEKSAIQSGQVLLTSMTEHIKQQLGK